MYIFNTKYGNIGIEATQNSVSKIVLDVRNKLTAKVNKNTQTKVCEYQLVNYFKGKRINFNVKCNLSGLSIFTQKVLNETKKIPYGKTATYSEIAEKIGLPKASRAVGQALSKNPLPIIIPCHRVLRKDKSLGGFAYGLEWKKRLLDLEKATNAH